MSSPLLIFMNQVNNHFILFLFLSLSCYYSGLIAFGITDVGFLDKGKKQVKS